MARVLLREAVFLAGEPVDVDAALDGVPEDAPPRARVPAHPEPALALLVELCERGEIQNPSLKLEGGGIHATSRHNKRG